MFAILSLNPTSGSWWCMQIQPTEAVTYDSVESHQRQLVVLSDRTYGALPKVAEKVGRI